MAHNLARAVGRLAGPDLEKATASTLQRRIFTVPGRLVHRGRQRHLRLPASWPWAAAIEQPLLNIKAIPLRCGPPTPIPTTRTSEGSVALSDRKRTTPQIFRPGDGRRTHCANTTPFSIGQDGRMSARCDSQPEDLLRRDDVDVHATVPSRS